MFEIFFKEENNVYNLLVTFVCLNYYLKKKKLTKPSKTLKIHLPIQFVSILYIRDFSFMEKNKSTL
jgi:hypothetical protein